MTSEHHCDSNLPRSLVHISLQNPSTVSWENMRGGGLPDHSSNEWNLIVSFFEKGHGERSDQTELVKFFGGNAEKSSTFRTRLHCDLKRRSKGGKIPEVARINKQRKTSDNVSVRATPMISESLGGAAAAEGSCRGSESLLPPKTRTVGSALCPVRCSFMPATNVPRAPPCCPGLPRLGVPALCPDSDGRSPGRIRTPNRPQKGPRLSPTVASARPRPPTTRRGRLPDSPSLPWLAAPGSPAEVQV
jgi:hypothetical protein